MSKFLNLALFLSCFVAGAQPAFHWAKQFSSNVGGTGAAIVSDQSGYIYSTGLFRGMMDFDPGVAAYTFTATSYDGFVTKMDNAGNFVWAKQIGGSGDQGGRDIIIGKNGNVYLTGFQSAGVSFFSKITPSGNSLWTKTIAAYNIFSIGLDSIDNIYATGTFDYTKDFDPGPGVYNLTARGQNDIFICKLDSNGVFQWAKQIGGNYTSEDCYAIAVDKDGSVYASGNFSGTTYFGPTTSSDSLTANGGQDIFISKLNSNGNFLWNKMIGGTTNEFNYNIALGPNNSLALTGTFSGTLDVDPGVGVYNLSSMWGTSFLCRYDTSGQFTWGKQFNLTSPQGGSCAAYDVAYDLQGNIIVAGVFGFKVDFDLGADTFNLSIGYPLNIFIAKYDSKGNFICVGKIDASNIGDITTDPFGGMIALGQFNGTPDFDPSNSVHTLNYTLYSDIFVTRWACGVFTEQYETAKALDPSVFVFPNPSTGIVEIHCRQTRICDLILNIYDSQGRLMINETLEKVQVDWKKQFNLSEYSKGLYLLEMIADDVKTIERIVLD
jgi:hypothetical protein